MSDIMSLFVKKASDCEYSASEKFGSCLARLRRQNPAVQHDIESHNLIARLLVDPFEVDTDNLTDLSRVEVLALLVEDNPDCQASFLRAGGILKILPLIEKPRYRERLTVVAKLVVALSEDNPACARAFCKAGIMSSFARILEGSDPVANAINLMGHTNEVWLIRMKEALSSAVSILMIEGTSIHVQMG